MGLIRVLLATAVAWGHTDKPGMLAPYYCVQAFFVVSGFYMALIHEKYAGRVGLFYINRYTRLIVAYWIVAACSLIAALAVGTDKHYISEALKGNFPTAMVATNLFLFGQDAVEFFTIDGRMASGWLLVPQAWSLGAELLFYLLVPLLVNRSTRMLLTIVAASFALRVALAQTDLPFFPWQQRFFPAELALFIVGMLSYRTLRPRMRFSRTALGGCAMLTLLVGHASIANKLHFVGTALIATVLYFAIPRIFALSRTWRIDRLIGQFSYPIYLWHVFAVLFIANHVLLWTFMLSIPLVVFVEIPLERWRHSRLNDVTSGTHIKGLTAARRDV